VVDVLVTHSYHLSYDAKQLRKMQPYVPLAALYAAPALRESGISVAAFDLILQDPDEQFQRGLDEQRSRIVVVYEDDFNFLSTFGSLNRSPRRLAANPRWTELPFPARELIDLEPSGNAWIKAHGSFSTNMVPSLGCPYHCNWCAKPNDQLAAARGF
jgi:hypothetical protein